MAELSLKDLPTGTFARVNKITKEIEIVDEMTGEIVNKRGTYSDFVASIKRPFDPIIADHICNLIIEGNTLKKICRRDDIPDFSTVMRWRRIDKSFNEALAQAYEDRAHYAHDHAIEIAYETNSKEDVAAAKLKIETLKWAAERGNQKQFGSKTQPQTNNVTAQVVNILTGVPQPDEIDVTPQRGDLIADRTDTIVKDVEPAASGGGESTEGESD